MILVLRAASVALAAAALAAPPPAAEPVRVGCFFGGRGYVLFRAYRAGQFERAGVPVAFYSRYLNRSGYEIVPRTQRRMQAMRDGEGAARYFGKVTGAQLERELERGRFDAVTLGESAFLAAAARGAPIVAVASLAHAARGRPSEAIILRSGVVVRGPADFRGLRLASRRSSPGGESSFLRAFVRSLGLDPAKDVTLVDGVDELELRRDFREGKIDGALCHVEMTAELLRDRLGYVYRPMDWMDPAISQALIVFRRDFTRERPREVAAFVSAYADEVRREARRPEAERERETRKGLRTTMKVAGLELPQVDDPPRVDTATLAAAQTLLVREGALARAVDLAPFVDPRPLETADARR